MNLHHQTVSAGVLLSLLISAGATAPVLADQTTEIADHQLTNQVETTKTITGTIKSIVGEVVTLNLDHGGIETVRISQQTIKIKGLVPGTRIVAIVTSDNAIAGEVKVIPSIAEVRTETTRVQVRNQTQETHPITPHPVVMPAPRRTTESVEIRRTQERRVVTPAPAPVSAPVPQVEPPRPVRGMW